MLSVQEFENVYAWKPYRPDWPVDKNLTDQTILRHFGNLIRDMVNSPIFTCTQTQAGDITNYLEFLCYPADHAEAVNDQPGLLVCVSLCAPVAAYSEILFKKDKKSFAYSFPDPSRIGMVAAKHLKPIEEEIKTILQKHSLELISAEYAKQPMPAELAANLDSLNFGNTILHGLFQWRE